MDWFDDRGEDVVLGVSFLRGRCDERVECVLLYLIKAEVGGIPYI